MNSDQELVLQYLNGDIQAFNRLVWRWEQPILAFVMRMIGDQDSAQEITQKAFIKAYKNLKTLKDPAKFKTWLYQIAANLCRDELRRRKNLRHTSIDQAHEATRDGARTPDYMISNKETSPEYRWSQTEAKTIIRDALEKIPEEQRVVIIMKEYQGLKFKEIAEIMGQSINTIKSRMYYGINALRKIFEQWEINEEAFDYEL